MQIRKQGPDPEHGPGLTWSATSSRGGNFLGPDLDSSLKQTTEEVFEIFSELDFL
jgi:hypothetical protein